MDAMLENCRNPKVRAEMKQRLEAELKIPDLPAHRRTEVEALLAYIQTYEDDRARLDSLRYGGELN